MASAWKAGKTPVQLLPSREAILDVRHELLDGLQLRDVLLRDSRDALSRVEETVLGIPQLDRPQQGVLDAEALLGSRSPGTCRGPARGIRCRPSCGPGNRCFRRTTPSNAAGSARPRRARQ